MASNFTQSLSANRTGCAGCYLRHLCLSADLNDAETEIFSSHIVSQRRVPKGEVLFRAGAPLDALFVTRLGSFKSSVLTENGSEQVTDFHRSLRGKAQVRSVLDDIEGIGPTRRKALMRHFKDIDTIRSATAEELEQVPQMNRKAAESVYHFFHKPEKIQEDNAQAGAGKENT